MRKDLVAIVCCPADHAKLALEATQVDEHEDVLEGTLTCTECGFAYPIEDGIPNLLPPEFHLDADGRVQGTPGPDDSEE